MSILDALFGGLFGDEEEEQQKEVIEHPCSNCPGSCSIAPDACSVCKPYKEKMIDAIYWVEHKDELIDRYEVVGTNTSQGAVICPHCGGHSEDHYVCEYCGSKLQDGTGKIQVASAADIPNPVMDAQDLIFARYEAVKDFAGADEAYGLVDALSGVGSKGLLSSIFDALMGDSDGNDSKTIGNKMTEAEIREMADYYNVSVSEYLTGLDNGRYLTLSNKKTAAAAEQTYSSTHMDDMQGGSSLSGLAGLAGAIGLGSMLFGGSSYNYSAARKKPGYPGYGQYYSNTGSKPPQSTSPFFGVPVQQPRPQMQQPKPVMQQPKPQVQQPKPQVQQPKPAVKPSVQQSKPSVQQSKPSVQQSKPSVQQSKPAVKVPSSAAKPARTPSDLQGSRKPAGNTVSGSSSKEDAIRKAMGTVSANRSKAQTKPSKGTSKKP